MRALALEQKRQRVSGIAFLKELEETQGKHVGTFSVYNISLSKLQQRVVVAWTKNWQL